MILKLPQFVFWLSLLLSNICQAYTAKFKAYLQQDLKTPIGIIEMEFDYSRVEIKQITYLEENNPHKDFLESLLNMPTFSYSNKSQKLIAHTLKGNNKARYNQKLWLCKNIGNKQHEWSIKLLLKDKDNSIIRKEKDILSSTILLKQI